MKTKLLALLFLVGSAAFAAPRVVVGVGVGVAPAYGYDAPPPPAVAYVARAPVYPAYWGARAYYGPRWVASAVLRTVVTTVAAAIGAVSYCAGLRPSKASCSNARMPSRVMGRGL